MSAPGPKGAFRLAIPYGGTNLSIPSLAQAANGLCELLWLVDLSDPDAARLRRLMARTGIVVDLTGQPPGAWADVVGPHRPDGVVAFSDTDLGAVARMAEALHLRFFAPDVVGRLVDKARQRQAFRAAGLPSPKSWVLAVGGTAEDREQVAAEVSYPAVCKPQFGNDSKLTYPVPDAASLRRLFADGPDVIRVPMVVEEYLADTASRLGEAFANYLSVESLVRDGTARHFAITGRFPPSEPFRESGFFIPSTVAGADRDAVEELTSAAIRALGVTSGCMHTEIKFTPDGPRVIEVNGRLGGGIPLMYELATGGMAVRMAMAVALGAEVGAIPEATAETGFRFLFHGPMWARRVTAVHGLEDVGNFPEVRSVTLHRGPGSAIDWRTGNHDYVFSVAGVTAGSGPLPELRDGIDRTVTVSYAA